MAIVDSPTIQRPTLPTLRREVGILGATMMGLGSIIGTGVFVGVGTAAGSAGSAVVAATGVAALVAVLNGLSSAQLAAAHPVSGGTYEYGYRWLHPSLGFTAGWMFLCAKSASAATAALGFAGYGLNVLGLNDAEWRVPLALAAVVPRAASKHPLRDLSYLIHVNGALCLRGVGLRGNSGSGSSPSSD